jgi:hypothetical protein
MVLQAAVELDAHFGSRQANKRPCCVVLVDEQMSSYL